MPETTSNEILDNESIELQKLYNEVNDAFMPLKRIIDKFPTCIELDYHPKEGYFIEWDLTCLIPKLRILAQV
jgi:hypothetical protein